MKHDQDNREIWELLDADTAPAMNDSAWPGIIDAVRRPRRNPMLSRLALAGGGLAAVAVGLTYRLLGPAEPLGKVIVRSMVSALAMTAQGEWQDAGKLLVEPDIISVFKDECEAGLKCFNLAQSAGMYLVDNVFCQRMKTVHKGFHQWGSGGLRCFDHQFGLGRIHRQRFFAQNRAL